MAKAETTSTATDTEGDKPTRKRLSPVEKAQKTLATAQKRYDRAAERRAKYDADIAALDTELSESERFLDFAKGSKHLPENQGGAGTEGATDEAPEGQDELFTTNA